MTNEEPPSPPLNEVGDPLDRAREIITPMVLKLTEQVHLIGASTPDSTPRDMTRALSMMLAGFYVSNMTDEGWDHPPAAAQFLAQALLDDFASAFKSMRRQRRTEWAAQQPAG